MDMGPILRKSATTDSSCSMIRALAYAIYVQGSVAKETGHVFPETASIS